MSQNLSFDPSLNFIRELHPRPGKKLYSVVVVRVMRSRNHHPSRKSLLAYQTSYAGSGNDSGEGMADAFLSEPGGNLRSNMRTRFAGVGADKHSRMFSSQAKIAPNAAADPVKRLIVQGIFAGDAPDTVSPKEFFGHFERVGLA